MSFKIETKGSGDFKYVYLLLDFYDYHSVLTSGVQWFIIQDSGLSHSKFPKAFIHHQKENLWSLKYLILWVLWHKPGLMETTEMFANAPISIHYTTISNLKRKVLPLLSHYNQTFTKCSKIYMINSSKLISKTIT